MGLIWAELDMQCFDLESISTMVRVEWSQGHRDTSPVVGLGAQGH